MPASSLRGSGHYASITAREDQVGRILDAFICLKLRLADEGAMIELTTHQLRKLRLRSQRLDGEAHSGWSDPAGLLYEVCGVQAQEARAAELALWVRGSGPTAAHVERARIEDRSIVRTWCMRGTIHLLASEDLGWLMPLLGPVFVRKSARRYAELGLSEEICRRAVAAISDILNKDSPLSRGELAGRLGAMGFPVEGQAAYHLVRRAGLEGVLCFGPELGKEPTYVPLGSWARIGEAMEREEALARLAKRYLEAFGPAGPEDLATWSGLSLRESRRAFAQIGGELVEVECGDMRSSMLKSQEPWLAMTQSAGAQDAEVTVRLLPAYDSYLLGYRDRALSVPQAYAKRVHPGGGLLRPVLLAGGRAVGTWRLKRKAKRLEVTMEPFEPLSAAVRQELDGAVGELGRFLELPVRLSG
jgi:hypothetical protein